MWDRSTFLKRCYVIHLRNASIISFNFTVIIQECQLTFFGLSTFYMLDKFIHLIFMHTFVGFYYCQLHCE